LNHTVTLTFSWLPKLCPPEFHFLSRSPQILLVIYSYPCSKNFTVWYSTLVLAIRFHQPYTFISSWLPEFYQPYIFRLIRIPKFNQSDIQFLLWLPHSYQLHRPIYLLSWDLKFHQPSIRLLSRY
jgi:hypothetical protein